MNDNIKGHICRVPYRNNNYLFFVHNERDVIQKFHFSGQFYEIEDLELIRGLARGYKRVIDVGSNVGNHAVFFAKEMAVESVIAFEPNSVARDILEINVLLNSAHQVKLEMARFAIGQSNESAFMHTKYDFNLGHTKIDLDSSGDVTIRRLDDLVVSADFIKIDVEGFEMQALCGMEELIAKSRPDLYVEVDNENQKEFNGWVSLNNYAVIHRLKRYKDNENYFLRAIDRF